MARVEIETETPCRHRLTIEIPEDEVSAEVEQAYTALKRRAQVRGFRRGHAPRAILQRQFGDQVRGDVFERLIRDALADALREHEIDAVGAPEVVTERAELGQPLRFTATVEVRPEVEARGYDGLELERVLVKVTDADVDRYLDRLRQSLAQLRPIEDRSVVVRGDVAVIDFEGRVGDEVVLQGTERPCEVGGGDFPEAFEARLIGADAGESMEFPVTFPADAPNPKVAGRTVDFRVSIRSLAVKEVPPLDDEFAKDQGEGSIEELRAGLKQRLEGAASAQADRQVRSAAISKLVSAHDVELPDGLVKRQMEQLMIEVAEGWRAQRIWPKDEDAAFAKLREDLAPRARSQVKAALVLDAIAAQERVEVTDAEVEAEVSRTAAGAGERADRVRSMAADPAVRRNIGERLRREQALNLVLDRARIQTVERNEQHVAGEGKSR